MKACRHLKADRPCKYYWIDRSWDCFECEHHNPYNERILLIKLDALGDVVRSTALAEGIKKKYPNCQLSWITVKDAMFFVKSNPFVDRVLEYNDEVVRQLQFEEFDMIVNLDKDPKATSMMMLFNSEDKRGYGMSSEGHVVPLNDSSEYHYNICLDNWGGKTKNKKSYQELIFEIAELNYDMEKPFFKLDSEKIKDFESDFLYGKDLVILNTGCGPVYPHKKWTFDGYNKLIKLLTKDTDCVVLLCGSKSEIELNEKLYEENKSDSLINLTDIYDLEEFSYLIKIASVIVTGDTVALHIAISLGTKIVSFFGPTPHQEVNLFGLGIKLVREELDCLNCYDQFPCPYDGKCMSLISAKDVHKSIRKVLLGATY